MNPPLEASRRPADRRKLLLTLGAPYALLVAASLVAWPWRALEIPGTVGTLTPPSFLLLVTTVAASTYALRRRLPLSMITWIPAGQGAIVLLATGLIAGGSQDQLTGLAFIIAYGVVFLIVLALTTAIAAHGGPLAFSFIAFFVFTQAARIPIFEVEGSAPIAGASWFTLAASLRAVIEISIVAWLARRLVEAADASTTKSALLILGLVISHGVLASWEDPLLRGALTIADASEQVFRWLLLVGIQLGMATVLIRFRRAQFRELELQEATRSEQQLGPSDARAASGEDGLPRVANALRQRPRPRSPRARQRR